MALDHLGNRLGIRPVGIKNRRRAERQGGNQDMSERVGEKKLGRAEHPVAAADADHLAQEILGAEDHFLGVDNALGLTRGARRIDPESRIVATQAHRFQLGRGPLHEIAEQRVIAIRLIGEDHPRHFPNPFGQAIEIAKEFPVDKQIAAFAVLDDIGQIPQRKAQVQGNRHGTDLHQTEIGVKESRRIAHDHQHPLAHPDPQTAKGVACPVGSLHEHFVGHHIVTANDCRILAVAARQGGQKQGIGDVQGFLRMLSFLAHLGPPDFPASPWTEPGPMLSRRHILVKRLIFFFPGGRPADILSDPSA